MCETLIGISNHPECFFHFQLWTVLREYSGEDFTPQAITCSQIERVRVVPVLWVPSGALPVDPSREPTIMDEEIGGMQVRMTENQPVWTWKQYVEFGIECRMMPRGDGAEDVVI